jgi:CBS domain containing-hemolysin-like protein
LRLVALDLVIAVALVAANAFFVATEFALARLRPTQVEEMEREGKPGAKSLRHAVDRIDAYLAACQLGITLASLGLGVVGEAAFHDLLKPVFGDATKIAGFGLASAVAFGIITLLHVVLGELAPKSVAISRTRPTALLVGGPMRAFYLVTKPLVDFFNGLGNLVLKPFGIPPAREAGSAPHSEDELRALLREASEHGTIEAEEQQLGENVLLFGDRRAREVMRPRPQVRWLAADQSVEEAASFALESGLSRLPVCDAERGLDTALGVVHVKDLLGALLEDRRPALSELVRDTPRVSDSVLIDELLRDLRRGRAHVALVVDEHGTTVGLVTVEDIVEEIFGEIEDEFDPEEESPIVRVDGRARIRGDASLRQVGEELGIEIGVHHEATVGGHVVEALGRLPEVGEEVEVYGRRAEVTQVSEGRVGELCVDDDPER